MSQYNRGRRDFLKKSLMTMGVMMMPFPRGLFSNVARATALGVKGTRQHLITIIDNGAWDQSWFLNYLDPKLNSVMENTPAGWAALNKLRYGSASTAGVHAVTHPNGSSVFAPGMKFWGTADYNRFFFARGMNAVAGHNQHQFIYGGGTSPYMASASALIAAYQADARGAAPLHYVKLTTGTRDFINSGMMTGIAIPSLMPDHASWKTLTTPTSTTAPVSVSDGVAALGKIAQDKVKRDASKGVVNGYMNGYSSSILLSSSQYATSDEFITTWFQYFNAIYTEVKNHLTQSGGLGMIGDFRTGTSQATHPKERPNNTFQAYYGGLNALTLPTTLATQSTFLNTNSGTADVQMARTIAWKFAFAEFLVVKDLSAVVDLQPTGGDDHNLIIDDVGTRLMGMTCVRKLAERLSAVRPADCNGDSLLDRTLITYASEFERGSKFSSDNVDFWGNSHSSSFSMIMAGHKSNMGKVLGELSRGDSASVPVEYRNNDGDATETSDYGLALAFDPVTGERKTGADPLSPYSFLPTVLKMFSVPLPSQQITEYQAIPFFMKS